MIGNRIDVVIGPLLAIRLTGIDKQRTPVERGGQPGRDREHFGAHPGCH
jgi:hypothetical protein